ncbi:MAG: hypothetical protein IKZ88_00085 [Neisseriaceae bacterium]|nr:hypothetical protein [Neisseriaceae bacterium]
MEIFLSFRLPETDFVIASLATSKARNDEIAETFSHKKIGQLLVRFFLTAISLLRFASR